MRVVILSNDKPSFQKPMADGLARILQNNSVTTKVLYEGLDSLEFPYVSFRSRLISFTKRLLKSLFKSSKVLFINRSIGIEKLIKRIIMKRLDFLLKKLTIPASHYLDQVKLYIKVRSLKVPNKFTVHSKLFYLIHKMLLISTAAAAAVAFKRTVHKQ